MTSFWLYAVSCTLLAVYSYGFLDFNLTLSSHPLFLNFVVPLQHLVYFDRHLSTQVYIGIFIVMFCAYIGLMVHWFNDKLISFPWRPILLVIAILTIAYPMLSYDVFNYMFHGKILWLYHMNPHTHAPLEYTGDLWLRFMRWVHTPSAYGPVFTAIESPAYLLGMGKFVPVLYLMKMTMAGFFIWCIYLIGKIGERLKFSHDHIIRSQLLLALNPFLLLELVINGHNDAVMIALFLWVLTYSLKQTKVSVWLALTLSVGVKYITALTAPVFLLKNPQHKILTSTALLLAPVLLSPGRFQPWYLTWALIPSVLINTHWSRVWFYLASLAGLIYYIPYIYTGFWNNSLPFVACVLYLPIVLTIIFGWTRGSTPTTENDI